MASVVAYRTTGAVDQRRWPAALRWSRRKQFRQGWKLLWTQRLRRDLDPIYRLIACRRGRHRDAHVLADALVGSMLAQDYPEAAICEVCGRVVEWPNGTVTPVHRWEQ